MAPRYKKGQHVAYKPTGVGITTNSPDTTGKITDVLTEPSMQAERNVDASKMAPRYEIVNDNTGKATNIFEENIVGYVSGQSEVAYEYFRLEGDLVVAVEPSVRLW
ncbi:hypothetical protein F4780DRAFT_25591 [Xylariomycetidae sp. FL0641]|nr:hypothetical protein F4780DRAFT_25591 [Xylariomycetidae sp. FL0641]